MKKVLFSLVMALTASLMATETVKQPQKPVGLDKDFFKKYKEHMISTATQEGKIVEEYKKCATNAQDKQSLKNCSTKKMEGMRTMHEKQRASMESTMNPTRE